MCSCRGLVRAKWIRAQRIARVGEGAGTRSSADVAVFADSAFSVKLVWSVEPTKYFRVTIDVNQRSCAHAAATQRQETGRIDIAQMGNENDAVAIANLKSSVDRTALDLGRGHSCGAHSVKSQTPVGRGLSGLDCEGRAWDKIKHPVHDAFAFFRRDRIQGLAAAHGNQKEQAPTHDGKAGPEQLVNGRKIVD